MSLEYGVPYIYEETYSSKPSLAFAVPWEGDPEGAERRYGCEFIQFPELGRPSGGSSWMHYEAAFRSPKNEEEHLWVRLFETARNVRRLKDELEQAEADAAAVRRYAEITGMELRGV